MFERFTESARAAVIDAREQAEALHDGAVGVEHLLLGVLHVPGRAAAEVLRSRGVTEDALRSRFSELVGDRSVRERFPVPPGFHLPFTPRAKEALELALRESLALGTDWIGPEHLLLGISRQEEHVAMRILRDGWGLSPEMIRGAVIESPP